MIELMGYAAMSFALIGAYRWLALHYLWLDHPNHRSAHTTITPRGAGLIFTLIILSTMAWKLRDNWTTFFPFLFGLVVALIGWMDDVRGTSARLRFALYLVSSAVTVTLIFIKWADPTFNAVLAFTYGAIAALGVLWLINLYNFMDGINGLAALEAIFVLLSVNLLDHDSLYGQTFSEIHLVSCAALTGFLFWNFPAGKVFMGDAGSAFLGFFLGTLILVSWKLHGPTIAVWLILLAIFIADTVYTLLVRIGTKQQWYEAHRLHAYQLLTNHLKGSHARSTAVLMIVNLSWLLPIAWFVHTGLVSQTCGLTLAYLPLLIACHRLKAGILQPGTV